MGFFKLFSNKNPDFLKDDEVEAAKLLQSIVNGYANNNPNYIPDGITKLTIGVYHIAFNRTNKDIVSLKTLKSSKAIAKDPNLSKYLALIKVIRLSLEKFVGNKKVHEKHQNEALFKEFMLQTIKSAVEEINKI